MFCFHMSIGETIITPFRNTMFCDLNMPEIEPHLNMSTSKKKTKKRKKPELGRQDSKLHICWPCSISNRCTEALV